MPKGTLRALCSCFRPGKYAVKDELVDSKKTPAACEAETSSSRFLIPELGYSRDGYVDWSLQFDNRSCSSVPYMGNGCISGVFYSSPLETIAEVDECSDHSHSCARQPSSSSPPDSSYQMFVDCGSLHRQSLPSASNDGNEACTSDRVGSQEQATEGLVAVGSVLPTMPENSTSEEQALRNDDCHELEDVLDSTTRYWISKEVMAGEPNVRFAIDTHSGTKVILVFYRRNVYCDHGDLLDRFKNCKHLPKVLDANQLSNGWWYLVFDRGDFTLSEWMTKKHSPQSRKQVLAEILEALVDLRNHGVMFGNLKPSTLMWFSSDHSWKFLGPYLSLEVASKTLDSYSRRYTAPELIRNERWRSKDYPKHMAWMWTFGVIAFEILSGRSFHGTRATLQAVGKFLIGKEALPSLSRIREPIGQIVLKKLLSIDPCERPTAKEALENIFFHPA